MFIRNIYLNQFRNYSREKIEAGPGINVFYGNNAQGKTNILEAIYLCACARSHRTARDSELINHNQNYYTVKIEYTIQNGSEESLEVNYYDVVKGDPQRNKAQRIVRYNEMKLDRISEMMGIFHAVIFAPEDLMLVKEGPSTRRRYIDLLISQISPSYFLSLQQYSRNLSQRNRLLKNLREKKSGSRLNEQEEMQLDIWDISLAEQAAYLIQQRIKFTKIIGKLAQEAHDKITSGKEKLNVKYKTIANCLQNTGLEEIKNNFYNKLKSMIYEDIERGSTSSGPHRDDLELSLNDGGLKLYASQGQQRSTVLSLKLAELEILRQETGESPILLLDDVMSELDESRRINLLENIKDSQVFVTCTDASQIIREIASGKSKSLVAEKESYSFYHVVTGKVSRSNQILPS